jgi:hypothetical protein
MGKENKFDMEKANKFSLLNNIWGIVVSALTIFSLGLSAGWYFGKNDAEERYKIQLEDYKFEKLQMQLDFQIKLREEKDKWEINNRNHITLEELRLFFTNHIETKKQNE